MNFKILIITILTLAIARVDLKAQVYVCKAAGMVKFYSKATLEDITATNNVVTSVLKTQTGEITFKATIKKFEFAKDLMYQHFLEKKYMWAEQHPYAVFSGKIVDLSKVDFNKDGLYNVVVKGQLTIRGIPKEYEVPATLNIKDGKIEGNAVFNVALVDHEVPRPSVVIDNIAEVVEVTVKLVWEPYTKEKQD